MLGLSFYPQLLFSLMFQALAYFLCPIAFNIVLHAVVAKQTATQIESDLMSMQLSKFANFSRLLRSLLYCSIASLLGPYLLLKYFRRWPHDLLFLWNEALSDAFIFALSHWIASLFEDAAAYDQLNKVLLKGTDDAVAIRGMFNNLVAHHGLTIFAYSWALHSHNLAGLCVFGLCFELPVVLMDLRELVIVFDPVFRLVESISFAAFRTFWTCLYTAWHIGRTAPCLHYPISLIFWRQELSQLPTWSLYTYHALGLIFNYGNITLLFRYLALYLREDSQRLGLVLKREETVSGAVNYAFVESGQRGDDSSLVRANSHASKPKKLMGPQEVSTHSVAGDCYVILNAKVYDVTPFLSVHPGGAEALLQRAGSDVTAAFNEIGHSPDAKALLSKYYVADLLAHGYDQQAKTSTSSMSSEAGDTSAPYMLFKNYFTLGHPWLAMLVFAHLSLYVIRSQSRPSSSLIACLSTYVRVMLPALVLVAVFSIPVVQSYMHSGNNSPWLGQQSHMNLGRNLVRVLASWRTHVAAVSFLLVSVSDIYLVANSSDFSLLRLSFLGSSALQFVLADLGGGFWCSREALCMLGSPCALLRALIRVLEHPNLRAHVLLVAAVAVETVAFVFARKDDSVRRLLSAAAVSSASRLLFFYTFQRSVEHLHGDSFGGMSVVAVEATLLAAAVRVLGDDKFVGLYSLASLETAGLLDLRIALSWETAWHGLVVFLALTTTAAAVSWSRASFALHVYSLGNAVALWPYNPPSEHGAQWVAFWLSVGCLQGVSSDADRKLSRAETLPAHYVFSVKHVENLFKAHLTNALYQVLRYTLLPLLSALAPYGYKYWSPPSAVIDLGDRCEYGMAYLASGSPQLEPTVFQCNVGYTTLGGHDVAETADSTRLMLKELIEDPEAGNKGFVNDLVVIFEVPRTSPAYREGKYSIREVNLSGWASEAAAHAWYKNSPAHREIVKKYYGAGLHDFSALLASLKAPPGKPMRWEVRCRSCLKVSSGPRVEVCPYCQSPMPPMPYF